MQAKVVHPETGEELTIDIPALQPTDLDKMAKEYSSDKEIRAYIEKLPGSAEVKAILFKLAKFTITVGETLIRFGKRILEIVVMLVSKYQNASFGLVIGALLTFLIGLIPWLGPLMTGFLGPLLMLYGIGQGFLEDLKKESPKLVASITEAGSIFEPLKANNAL